MDPTPEDSNDEDAWIRKRETIPDVLLDPLPDEDEEEEADDD